MGVKTKSVTLVAAIAKDAYDWMAAQNPMLLEAIRHELEEGRSPAEIRLIVSANVGPDRQALATRCYHAAVWIDEYEEE